MNESKPLPLLVVGAGISGISAALEAAEAGHDVVLVEREASVGGRVLRTHNYFPKLCPPSCGLEINVRRIERNPRIEVMTQTEVTKADKANAGWTVTLTSAPEYVNSRCTLCGECSKVCPATVKDPFNLEMNDVPAIRLHNPNAWPRKYLLDRDACPEGCTKCAEACEYEAIELDAKQTERQIEASAVILTTGWNPYPLDQIPELGGGKLDDVIANVQMERLAAPTGPTEGKILKPSNGEAPKKVAFVQCAGSRDVNHLPYCSGVCCLASLKQATYVKEQSPDAEVTMYYIDRRTPGRNEDVLTKISAIEGVRLVKGKVGKIEPGENGDLKLRVEDAEAGVLLEETADLVVLATGMVPNLKSDHLPFEPTLDDDGFGLDDLDKGVVVAGVSRRAEDVASSVRDATGAAARACIAAGRRA